MTSPALSAEIQKQLDLLSIEQQHQVLEYARALASKCPQGVPGASLARFAGSFRPEDLTVITQAIEDGCEQVHDDEW